MQFLQYILLHKLLDARLFVFYYMFDIKWFFGVVSGAANLTSSSTVVLSGPKPNRRVSVVVAVKTARISRVCPSKRRRSEMSENEPMDAWVCESEPWGPDIRDAPFPPDIVSRMSGDVPA